MIHPQAIVSDAATLDPSVEVGPFAIIEAGVVIGAGTRIGAYSYLCSGTTLGRDNVVHIGVVLGHEPQDLAYRGAPTRLVIGDRNVFREGSQVHRGTLADSETVIGNDCYLMVNAHVAHNCRLDDQVIVVNGALIAGHVEVGAQAFISGNAVVHQHTRIGRLAMLQGGCAVSRDVPPFCVASGINTMRAVNVVGLRRAGYQPAQIGAIRRAFRTLFWRRPNLRLGRERLVAAESAVGGPTAEVREMLDFMAASKRGVCAGPRGSKSALPGEDA
jgi:UDP-N-acetylglucosamine acyltransferase